MKDSTNFRRTNGQLSTLFDQIDRGELGLPELQRPFVWGKTKVRELFDSMYRGYPIGYFLFWANESDDSIKSKHIGINEKDLTIPKSLIIDGQQRLTALYSVVKNRTVIDKNFKKEKLKIAFNPISELFKVSNAATDRNKEYIADISEVFFKSTYSFVNEYFNQLDEYKVKVSSRNNIIINKLRHEKNLNNKEIEFIVTRFNQLEEIMENQERAIMKIKDKIDLDCDDRSILIELLSSDIVYEKEIIAKRIERLSKLKDYPYDALEINSNVEEEVVAEIFTRINSKGTSLNQADFVLTLLSVFWEEGRQQINNYCESFKVVPTKNIKHSPYNYICDLDAQDVVRINIGVGFKRGRMKDAYAILKGRDLITRKFNSQLREQQFEVFKQTNNLVLDNTNWHRFLRIILGCGFKSSDFISSKNAVIYSYTIFLIALTEYDLDHKKIEQLISKWFFMVAISSRYSSSPESRMESDLNKIKECKNAYDFEDFIVRSIESVLTNDFWCITLPNDLLVTSSANSPAGNVFFACQIKNKEKALFSEKYISDLFDPAIKVKKKSLERHHIFPANYLKKNKVSQTERNQIANMVYLEYLDNINISDEQPSIYIKEITNRYYKNREEELESELKNHAIPVNFHELSYSDFLIKRRELLSEYIRLTFEKY